MSSAEWMRVESVAVKKARDDGRDLAACALTSDWKLASARTRRARRAFMSPTEFTALVAGWSASLVLLLFFSALARYLS